MRRIQFDNLTKILILVFCARFHLYLHVWSLIAQMRGLTLVQLGLIETVSGLTIFLMEVPTGVLADRIGRKWSVALAFALLACTEVVVNIAGSFPPHPLIYIGIGLLTGLGWSCWSGALEALAYESLPPDDRPARMARFSGQMGSVAAIGFFLSPLVGSFILSDITPERASVAIAGTMAALLIGLLVTLTLRVPANTAHPAEKRPTAFAIARAGLAQFRHLPALRRLALFNILSIPVGGFPIVVAAAPFLAEQGIPPAAIALTLSFGFLIAAFSQRQSARIARWLGERRAIILLSALPGTIYLALALAGRVAGGWAGFALIIVLYGVLEMRNPLLSAAQNAHIADGQRATALSAINMGINLYVAAMIPAASWLAGQIGYAWSFAALGLIIVSASAIFGNRLPFSATKPRD